MFQKMQRQLLLSYLLVFASILGIFAIAVRIFFTRSLTHQLINELTALGQGAAANTEFDKGKLIVESDLPGQNLEAHHQGLQWFDTQGRLVKQQGSTFLSVPFSVSESQSQDNLQIKTITLPIISSDQGRLIGYVRVSQDKTDFNESLHKLDLGLGGGIVVALVFSGIGGVWLTRQAMQPMEESFQRLKQFTADASHELRSPLMAVKSNAAVALKYPEGMRETDTEKFQAIASATNQMTRLTEDLLLLARTDKVKHHSPSHLDLTEILAHLVDLYKPQAIAKQINLKSQFPENIYLMGDAVELTRLFTNLIDNALHYTPSGGVVEIKSSRTGTYIDVTVEDTGVGIAAENMTRVFERFWRADQSRSYWAGGSGLGLAIAQAIAQKHSGTITLTSQLGVGSCFTVRFST